MLLVGCAGDDDERSDSSTTVTSGAAPSTGSTGSSAAPTSVTTGPSGPGDPDPIPSAPSTVPPSVEGPCRALAETYGLDALVPIDSSSWVDERQRVVVDARRERDLLRAAQDGAPGTILAPLDTMAVYAGWLADTVQASSSYADAVAAIDAYPQGGAAESAEVTVALWRIDSCPA
jgi:hypothetical protein